MGERSKEMPQVTSKHGSASSPYARMDYWRCSPARLGGRAGHKEWSHFFVFGPGIDLLINFNLSESGHAAAAGMPETARVLAIARLTGNRWAGGIATFEPHEVDVSAGRLDAAFGSNYISFEDGCYKVGLLLPQKRLSAEITMQPQVRPAIASSVRLSDGGAMRWLVVPRLLASGVIDVDDKSYALDQALVYHDRNWGHFEWGGDYSWEWATILPVDASNPWSMVYMRIGDRFRNRILSQAVIVWSGSSLCRTFHNRDVLVTQTGLQKQDYIFRVPPIIDIASPGLSADIPKALNVEAKSGRDKLDLSFEFDNFTQIGVPNDTSSKLTLLSETLGRVHIKGELQGRNVDFSGRTIAEFNHAGN